jgi:N-acetylglutamate synthase
MPDIAYAEMTIGDYDAVYALWERSEGVGFDDACDTREAIARYISRNPETCFVARRNGDIVGAVLCGHDGRRGCIYHLAVDASHRRLGIGRTLVDKCMAALEAQGVNKCNIVVKAYNDDGQAFWESVGWFTRPDLLFMQKWTDPNVVGQAKEPLDDPA